MEDTAGTIIMILFALGVLVVGIPLLFLGALSIYWFWWALILFAGSWLLGWVGFLIGVGLIVVLLSLKGAFLSLREWLSPVKNCPRCGREFQGYGLDCGLTDCLPPPTPTIPTTVSNLTDE